MVRLDELYYEVKTYIDNINFDKLWKDFKPLKFALYNEYECFFDGKYIEKTNEFLGNTAISFNGEMIAIWNIMEEIEPIILCSKMIHEMFHGFQNLNNEKRFPNEFEAIYTYQYSKENLIGKLMENNLIIELLDEFDLNKFKRLLSLRNYRRKNFSFEYSYESKIEQIEGTANFVELQVLKQLSNPNYLLKIKSMKESIIDKKNLFPIRIVSYDIGALLLMILKENNIQFNEEFNDITFLDKLVDDSNELSKLDTFITIDEELNEYILRSKTIIEKAILKNDVLLKNETQLLGFNVYNARYYNGFIVSRYFVMYGNEKSPTINYGDFVIEAKNNIVSKIYRI